MPAKSLTEITALVVDFVVIGEVFPRIRLGRKVFYDIEMSGHGLTLKVGMFDAASSNIDSGWFD